MKDILDNFSKSRKEKIELELVFLLDQAPLCFYILMKTSSYVIRLHRTKETNLKDHNHGHGALKVYAHGITYVTCDLKKKKKKKETPRTNQH